MNAIPHPRYTRAHAQAVRPLRGFGSPSLDGIQLVPPFLVGALRGVLQTQGIDPRAVNDAGEIDPAALMALAFSKVEIRSRLHDPITLDMRNMNPEPGVTAQLLQEAQPAVILHLRTGGSFTIAPNGVPTGGISEFFKTAGMDVVLGIGAGLLGLVLFGYAIGGKRR